MERAGPREVGRVPDRNSNRNCRGRRLRYQPDSGEPQLFPTNSEPSSTRPHSRWNKRVSNPVTQLMLSSENVAKLRETLRDLNPTQSPQRLSFLDNPAPVTETLRISISEPHWEPWIFWAHACAAERPARRAGAARDSRTEEVRQSMLRSRRGAHR
jgi:hypothetical protein